MRIAMTYTWRGIAVGSKGTVKHVVTDPKLGSLMTVKFDYGETHKVPKAATLPETVYIKRLGS